MIGINIDSRPIWVLLCFSSLTEYVGIGEIGSGQRKLKHKQRIRERTRTAPILGIAVRGTEGLEVMARKKRKHVT